MATLVISILGSGCTTFLYKGPTRPSSEVAIITSHETIVDEVDDVNVREHASGSFARLEVLPGPHRLGITLIGTERVSANSFGASWGLHWQL